MLAIIGILVAGAAAYFGFTLARNYTVNRLKYVDAVQKPSLPWIAGAIAFAIALPIAWLLPFVWTGVTAAMFGTSVGLGVSSGAKGVRGYLPPNS